eukprot:14010698-Alexandrium_andersonii.AAC.1
MVAGEVRSALGGGQNDFIRFEAFCASQVSFWAWLSIWPLSLKDGSSIPREGLCHAPHSLYRSR